MNTKQVFAALAIAAVAGPVLAVEATQLEVPVSTKTRAEVIAELEQARKDGTLMSGGEATVFVDRPVAGASRTREEVKAEARHAMRTRHFDDLYVG